MNRRGQVDIFSSKVAGFVICSKLGRNSTHRLLPNGKVGSPHHIKLILHCEGEIPPWLLDWFRNGKRPHPWLKRRMMPLAFETAGRGDPIDILYPYLDILQIYLNRRVSTSTIAET